MNPAVVEVERDHDSLASIYTILEQTTVITFLLEAVKDIQGTIRALDTKVGILLAALAIPIPFVKEAFDRLHHDGFHASPASVIGICATLLYVTAALIGIRALAGIGNAAQHVTGDEAPDNVFYAGGLYRLGYADALLTRSGLRSRRSLIEYINSVPRREQEIVLHLAHEVMSLAYIRDLKIHRQLIAFNLTAFAAVLGFLALVV